MEYETSGLRNLAVASVAFSWRCMLFREDYIGRLQPIFSMECLLSDPGCTEKPARDWLVCHRSDQAVENKVAAQIVIVAKGLPGSDPAHLLSISGSRLSF